MKKLGCYKERLTPRKIIKESCNFLGVDVDEVCGRAPSYTYSVHSLGSAVSCIAALMCEAGYEIETIKRYLGCSTHHVLSRAVAKAKKRPEYTKTKEHLDGILQDCPQSYKDLRTLPITNRVTTDHLDEFKAELNRLVRLDNSIKEQTKKIYPILPEVHIMRKEIKGKIAALKLLVGSE